MILQKSYACIKLYIYNKAHWIQELAWKSTANDTVPKIMNCIIHYIYKKIAQYIHMYACVYFYYRQELWLSLPNTFYYNTLVSVAYVFAKL